VVAHVCNPSYLGGRDWEDCSSRLVQAKSERDPSSKNKLSVVVHACNSSYVGGSQSELAGVKMLDPI
jgi:hypothetical protein